MLRLILILFLGLTLASTIQAEITAANAFDFLITGEITASIEVSPGDIDWVEDERAASDKAISNNPRDLNVAIELIDLYEKQNRDEESKEVAKQTLSAFRERYDQSKDEASAMQFAEVALSAGAQSEYDAAYLAMLPFLESRRAKRDTCITAIKIRAAQQDYELARRIAALYTQIYPRYAELPYQLYLMSFSENLPHTIAKTVQTSSENFLSKRNESSVDDSNVEEFVLQYFQDLGSKIDTPSLIRALELDPSNYEYNISAAVFRAMAYFFSKTFIQHLAQNIEEEGLEAIFEQADPELYTLLCGYLERALETRPKRDIQVYLGFALVNVIFGKLDAVEPYALLALETRPDLPESYDALLLNALLPTADGEGDLDPEVCNRAIAIYEDRIENVGETASDYCGIAGLYFSQRAEVDEASKAVVMDKTKYYIEKALEIDPGYAPALIRLSSYHIVLKDYERAIEILDGIPKSEDASARSMILHNRGIAKILNGNRESGIADLREAATLQPDNKKTKNALQELGVN
jgi:hypothetical protein